MSQWFRIDVTTNILRMVGSRNLPRSSNQPVNSTNLLLHCLDPARQSAVASGVCENDQRDFASSCSLLRSHRPGRRRDRVFVSSDFATVAARDLAGGDTFSTSRYGFESLLPCSPLGGLLHEPCSFLTARLLLFECRKSVGVRGRLANRFGSIAANRPLWVIRKNLQHSI